MVVGPEFAGKNLRWNLQWGGETISTTERGGPDPLYLLEEVGAAYRVARQVDSATAERGVCINTSPTIFVASRMEAVVGEPLEVVARIGDDGLPRESQLSIRWRKVSGPSDIAISAADAEVMSVTFSSPGEYELEVSATDGEMSREATVAVLARGSE